jgi:hypothetical protein
MVDKVAKEQSIQAIKKDPFAKKEGQIWTVFQTGIYILPVFSLLDSK